VPALIQVVSLACQAATVPPAASTMLATSATGGRPQSPVPTHGIVHWPAAPITSSETTALETADSLLVASGIKN
jgi:hypothetical protein